MKIQPIAQGTQTQAPPVPTNSAANAARERAIAKLTAAPTPQAAPVQTEAVQNPSQVSPEEMGAIKPQTTAQTPQITDESNIVEPEASVEATTPPEETPQSKQLAAIVRREKALRAQAQKQQDALKAREAELTAREAAINAKASSFDESKYISKDRFMNDPITVMNETGLSYDELVNKLADQMATPVDPRVNAQISKLEAEIKRLNDAREEEKQAQTKQQTQAYENAVNKIRQDATSLVESDPTYETINATNSIEDVVELIKETYDKDGILLSVEEAAQEVENYLIEEAIKLASIGKVKQRLSATSAVVKKTEEQKQSVNPNEQTQPGMKTLTNDAASTRRLSAKERALLAFRGELK